MSNFFVIPTNTLIINAFAGAPLFQCPNCGKVYVQKESLYVHVRYDCGKLPSLECMHEQCNYKSKRKNNLKRHIQTKHGITENVESFMRINEQIIIPFDE